MSQLFEHLVLVFDIETIPDLDTAKRLHPNLATLAHDADAYQALIALRQQEADTQFMRLPLHKVACLSFLWVENDQFTLKSLSLENHDEAQILNTFFRAFKSNKLPTLVSWNGSGFDIPVLIYRAMHHKLSAPAFLDETSSRDIKYNNYLSRYHTRHLDLMDKLSLYTGYARQPLDVVAGMCGLAGKQDISGDMVLDLVQKQQWHALTTYCESDVLNTWLIYLRWLRLVGNLSHDSADSLEAQTRQYLENLQNPQGDIRHHAFLQHWQT